MSKVVAEKVAAEKVKQKLTNGNTSPKKNKATTDRKPSKVAKPAIQAEETKDKDKVNKPGGGSRSSSPRKEDIDKQQADRKSRSRSISPRKGQRKESNLLEVQNNDQSRRSSSSKTEIISNHSNGNDLLNILGDDDDEYEEESNGSSVSLNV